MGEEQSPVSIGELLAAAREGDTEALDRLLALYRNYLRFLARPGVEGTLGAKADASDIVQETLLQAYRGFGSFQGATQGEWAGWLRRILARNLAMLVRRYRGTASRDVGRERKLQADVESSAVGLENLVPAAGETPSQVVGGKERSLALADALAELTDDHRRVIVCRNLQKLGWAQTAEAMGRSPEAVRKLWTRAIRRLGASLEGKDV